MSRGSPNGLILSLVVVCLSLLLPAGAAADSEGSVEGTVTVLPLVKNAVTTLTLGLDSDGAAGCMVSIVRIQDPEGKLVTANITSYKATLSYDGNLINSLDVRHQTTFPGTHTINNPGGTPQFNGTALASQGVAAPCDIAFFALRLIGTAKQPATVRLTFSDIRDFGGKNITQFTPVPEQLFLRGDARADGEVNVRDAVYILQYLAGIRDIGKGSDKVQPVNAASVKHDSECDVINLSDAIYILQYVVGRRGRDRE